MRIFKVPVFLSLLFLASCMNDDSVTPRRKGYFRISFPEKKYTNYNKDCPFTFEYPVYAKVLPDTEQSAEPCWLNIIYPQFKGKIYLSYKVINDNLEQYLEQCRMFAVKHEVKASAINERDWSDTTNKVYGLIYDIEGDAASNMQFYLTDSTKNFIRGALYFYSVPNKDSLAPVLKFLKEDITHMVETFRWKNVSSTTNK
jgi:gliding motility-associated lipoprotein GldD